MGAPDFVKRAWQTIKRFLRPQPNAALLNPFEYPQWSGITLQVWRNTPDLVDWAKKLWTDPAWSTALSVLRNERPYGWPARGDKVDSVQAAIELGRVQGYQDAINVLLSLPHIMPKIEAQIEADYTQTES